MKKVIALGGEPATGKSTIIKKLMGDVVANWSRHEPEKLVAGMRHISGEIFIIGDYSDPDHKFPGTDRLSMAVQPQAIKYLRNVNNEAHVLFEGDRLFNASLLEECADMADNGAIDFKIYMITADKAIKELRHFDRKDSQEEQFLKAKETKCERIMSSLVLMDYIKVYPNNTPKDLENIVNELRGLLFT